MPSGKLTLLYSRRKEKVEDTLADAAQVVVRTRELLRERKITEKGMAKLVIDGEVIPRFFTFAPIPKDGQLPDFDIRETRAQKVFEAFQAAGV